MQYVVCTIYKFVDLDNHQALQRPFLTAMQDNDVMGTLLLAREGINGTFAGTRWGVDRLLAHIESDPRLRSIDCKESLCNHIPFHRTKVKLKKEIVTMGIPGIDPTQTAGTYVQPKDWNALITDPAVTVVDTRNKYEVQVGTFRGAVNPNTDTFVQFPQYVNEHLEPPQHKTVAMFCTGGIRCEKATAYLKQKGFDRVYHLQGGILKYLQQIPQTQSLWQGECFVFDQRVTVTHGLAPGTYDLCYACRRPISEHDQSQDTYVKGVSCPQCFDQITDQQRQRFQNRQTQVQLAQARGQNHIGQPTHKKT